MDTITTALIAIAIFPVLLVVSIMIFSLSFLKITIQTLLMVFLGDRVLDIPSISLKFLD